MNTFETKMSNFSTILTFRLLQILTILQSKVILVLRPKVRLFYRNHRWQSCLEDKVDRIFAISCVLIALLNLQRRYNRDLIVVQRLRGELARTAK